MSLRNSPWCRVLAATLAFVVLFGTALSGGTWAAPPHAKTYTIYLSNSFLGNDWRVQMEHEAQVLVQKGPLAGRVDLHIVNSDNTPTAQIASLNSIIQTRPDAIVIDASSPDALNATIARACAQGIMVLTFDQVVTAPCAWKVETDWATEGPWLAEWMALTLHGKGNLFVDRGLPGAPISLLFMQAWNRVLKGYPHLHVIGYFDAQYALGPEQTGVASLIAAHPNVDGILAQAYAVGAMRALKNAGHKLVPITGATFNMTMVACVQQHVPCMLLANPCWLSALAIKYAVDALDGKIAKTAQHIRLAAPPFISNNVSVPGVKAVRIRLGVNAYPSLPGQLFLPVSPPWAHVTPQEALSGKV